MGIQRRYSGHRPTDITSCEDFSIGAAAAADVLKRVRRGFMLLEVCLAIIIVGVGITASMQLFAACTQQNRAAASMTVAINLANNIQELMVAATDVDTLDGSIFGAAASPASSPIDAQLHPLDNLRAYSQRIHVYKVDHKDLNTVVITDEHVRKIVVDVLYRAGGTTTDAQVYKVTFFRFIDK